ncbi:LacI family DNA-binding transcriptional regulator [Defluviitalea raffinosedens]|uniref:LacI family DNA-binding transcriptional regulator n=1 Tax=Defluviitalea raffinosedens TaxID=1450156 RepID=A0A7C8HFX1_9FIRM|nr:LacI family DNA-binding transcriptional regulator [Defluviitalea raffinosedens]KAE9632059.1 LacI family DNA-binding transcriptional regulator [Defluviitalea raffinosedens]
MTIQEIAEIAKVSKATVSLALNNKAGVSEETRNMILEIANKYGYNKKTSSNQKRNILFIKYIGSGAAIEQNGDFIATVIDAIEKTASNLGYNLIIKNIISSEFQMEIANIHFEDYTGVIFLGTEAHSEVVELLQDIPVPIVAVDNLFEKNDIDSVVMDNFGGIYKAVRYLISLGHKKIGYIDSTIKFSNFAHRVDAYYKSIKDFGLEKDQPVVCVTPNLEGAYIDMLKHLKQWKGEMPTAFLAANDTIAIGAVKALREVGLSIPDQISVMGFDDIPFCTMLDKTLTTIRVYKEKMGEIAVKLLHDKINSSEKEFVKILVRTNLIERESTAKKI